MERYDVITIGSGIGGLTAALTCARQGRSVLVLEAKKQFGGFCNPFARKKFWFDTGIHYVGEAGPGQPLHRHFERLGLLDELQFRELDPNGFDRYVFPNYEVAMCKGIDAYCERLTRDFPHEARGLRRFFDLVTEVAQTLGALTKISGPLDALRLAPRFPTLIKYHRATFSRILDDFVRDPTLRAALAGPGGDIGLPPSQASGLVMIGVLAHFLGGAYFPVGGTKGVRDAYVKLLEAHGATLKRNSPVAKILTRSGHVVGVRTVAGDEFEAPIVISNASAVTTLGTLLGSEKLSRRTRNKVARSTYSLGSICVFVGTDLQPQEAGLSDANVWHYPSIDIDALYQPALDGRLGGDLPFFMTVPTLKDPGTHAPAGKHTVELITFAPYAPFERWADQPTLKRDAAYKALKQQLGERLLERAERYLPGLRQHIEVLEVATPLTNRSYVDAPAGSIYGMDHTPAQIGLGRFGASGPVDGLYLCGADAMGAGIATCVASGQMAANAALRPKGSFVATVRRFLRPSMRKPAPLQPAG
ncbi:MAG: NAD(P)/FAD-dependent oxidoreductase [Myxococcales bacterium]|nr:NAD(P)/FAD-dependent oxidoreductase [Myxococcales bacterium]